MKKLFSIIFGVGLGLCILITPVQMPEAATVRTVLGMNANDSQSIAGEVLETCTTSIDASGAPRQMTLNSTDGSIYVTERTARVISEIDPATNTRVRTSAIGDAASSLAGIAYASNVDELYAVEQGNNNVRVLDADDLTDVVDVAITGAPSYAVFVTSTNEIYVTDRSNDNVRVINTTTHAIDATITVGDLPSGIAYDSTQDRVFVANNTTTGTVSVIDPSDGSVEATISVGTFPFYVTYDSVNEQIYVAHAGGGTGDPGVTVIDPATNAVVDTMANSPANTYQSVVYNENTDRIYATTDTLVSVFNPHTYVLVENITTPSGVYGDTQGMVYVPDVLRVYIAGFGTTNVCSMSF